MLITFMSIICFLSAATALYYSYKLYKMFPTKYALVFVAAFAYGTILRFLLIFGDSTLWGLQAKDAMFFFWILLALGVYGIYRTASHYMKGNAKK